jgi:hypothetical protein
MPRDHEGRGLRLPQARHLARCLAHGDRLGWGEGESAVDHLFEHLSMGVQAVRCGSTELPRSGNRLSTGVHGGPWGSTGTYLT